MYIKYTPDDRNKRLMTQAQADAAEQAWTTHRALSDLLAHARAIGVDEAAVHQLFDAANGDKTRVVNTLFAPLAVAGNRNAVLAMIAHAIAVEDAAENEQWQLLLVEMELATLAKQGIRSAQLSAGIDKDRLCPACHLLDQTVIGVHAGARAVIPSNCTCTRKGSLMVMAWIKRPDGSGYLDRA